MVRGFLSPQPLLLCELSSSTSVTGEDFNPFLVTLPVVVDLDSDGYRALTAALWLMMDTGLLQPPSG